MPDVTVKRINELERTYRGGMLKARAGLGVTSFGMQVVRLPPNTDAYPEHDHTHDGQEEVYVVIEGAATLLVGGQEHALERGVFARVGPNEKRKLVTGDERVTILALGGVPGKPFEVSKYTDEGEPDPLGDGG